MIRPIQEGDFPRFADLAGQLGYPVDPAYAAEQLRKEASSGQCATFVFEKEGAVIGWISCRVQERAYRPAYGEVAGLVVDGAHRGRGYGAELLVAAEDWFRGRGLGEVLIRSNTKRADAHRFYDREGYERAKTQTVFTKPL